MLPDEDKTKEQLINELAQMRQRVTELEASESERKQVEEALKESVEKCRSLVNEINDGVFVVDSRGSIVFANKAFTDIHGFKSPEELVGKSFIECIVPEVRDEVAKKFRDQVKT